MSDGDEADERRGLTHLKQSLSERNGHPELADEIEARIRADYERVVAILALDMCGFTALSLRRGIVHYLAMIRRMEEAARPAVEHNRGRVIKIQADNLFAIFDQVSDAIEASLDIFEAFRAINAVSPEDHDITGSIGIGYGPTLVIGEEELFGIEMNHACKIGEDCARSMEILLTPSAHAEVPEDVYRFEPAVFTIGEIEMVSQRFVERIHHPK
jgi:adenylate cyclase